MADLLYQMDKIIAAAQEFVPPEYHEAFLARVEGRRATPRPIKAITERRHEAIREFSRPPRWTRTTTSTT